ncbi:MAG: nucleotidyltransferase substrate binding protein, partial [Calditrichia bacterium]
MQRFETSYDKLWKHLKKYLARESGLVPPNSPKPIFRMAFENKITDNIDNWLKYANARVDTSHDYCEKKSANSQVPRPLNLDFSQNKGAMVFKDIPPEIPGGIFTPPFFF